MGKTGLMITVPGAFQLQQESALKEHRFCVLGYDFGNRLPRGEAEEEAGEDSQLTVGSLIQVQTSAGERLKLKVVSVQKGNRDPRYALRTNDCFICVPAV